jgi:hypothetical protein
MAWLCAKAGLSEIVDIAANLLHEFSHGTGWPETWWECALLWGQFECCHFNLEWMFRHRMYAVHALPLSLLADNATSDRMSNRFNFDSGVDWSFTFSKTGGGIDYCDGATMTGVHSDLWTPDHTVKFSWSYPTECAAGDGTDSATV